MVRQQLLWVSIIVLLQLAVTLGLAALSWYGLERRALALKDARLGRRTRTPARLVPLEPGRPVHRG